MPFKKKEVKEPGDIQFFSEIDMNPSHPDQIGSTYPAWYYTEQYNRLSEDIEQEKRMLTMFNLPDASKPVKIAKIKKMEERLEKIKEAEANFKPNMDKIKVMSEELSEKISEAMYRRNDETKGFVNPHKVAESLITPCIEISGDIARIASDNGFNVSKKGSKGLLNLNDASRLWQISRKALGEDSNVETLRRD